MRLKWVVVVACCGCLAAGVLWHGDVAQFATRAFAAAKGSNAPAAKSDGKQAAARAAPTVETAVARTGNLPIERGTYGKVQAVDTTDLTSREQGIITKIAVSDGADVKTGDLLVKLDDRALVATREKDQATLAKDQATYAEAQADMARNKALQAKGAASQQTYDQAVEAAKVAEANVEADKATVRGDDVSLADTEIRAPYDGRLGAFAQSVGALISPGTTVVRLTRMAPVEVSFTLPQDALAMMRKAVSDGAASVRIKADGNDKPVEAKIDFIDNQIDSTSGTFTARATVPNKDLALWPGEAVNLTVTLGERKNVVLVPTVAVQPAAEGSIVFVVGQDKKIEVRKVEVAGSAGDQMAIASGIKAGDHVVVEGQLQLTNGMSVNEKVEATKSAQTADTAAGTTPAERS